MQNDTDETARAAPEPAICNCLALRQASRHATQLYDRHLAAEGLTTSQYSILAKLLRLGPQSIGSLADMMVMDRTTTTRAVRPLARDRLVAIAPGEDERTRVVRITPAGEKRARAAAALWRAAQKAFEAGYGAKEAEKLRKALARVVAV
jgi:DNA-binding MarR family transcriptional regulator